MWILRSEVHLERIEEKATGYGREGVMEKFLKTGG
jgi:hypothetical protein